MNRRIWLTAGIIVVAAALAHALAGDLDTTFNGTGKVLTNFPGTATSDVAADVVVDTDGRIVAAGYTRSSALFGATNFALARYLPDGRLDESFGTSGKVITDVGGDQASDAASALAIDDRGRIIAVGLSWTFGLSGDVRKIAVVRYKEDGSLDGTFGSAGRVLLDFGEQFPSHVSKDVVIDRTGRIIVLSQSLVYPSADPLAANFDFVLIALGENGAVDTSFGTGGRVLTDFTAAWCPSDPSLCPHSADQAQRMALDSEGRIVVAGYSQIGGNQPDFALTRYLADGTPDATFGEGSGRNTMGLVLRDLKAPFGDSHNFLSALTIQSLPAAGGGFIDRIVVAGLSNAFSSNFKPVLMTYVDGFENVGPVPLDFGGVNDAVGGLAANRDFIYLAGASGATGTAAFLVMRLNSAVAVDQTFGTAGKVTTAFGPPGDFAEAIAVAIDAAGAPIAAGSATGSGFSDFAIARYKPTSAADLTLTKSGPSTALPGDALTYTLTITNHGPDVARNVVVSDHLPLSLTFVSCDATGGGVCAGAASDRTVTFASIPVGTMATVTLRGGVPASAADGTVMTNTAEVTGIPADPEPRDNTATVTTVIANRADVFLTQSVTKLANRQLRYTIVVRNLGPYAARDLLMNDPMPNGTNFVGVSPESWSCVPLPPGSVGTLSCRLNELSSDASAQLTFDVKTTAPGSVDMVNTAAVGSVTFDPNTANNAATLVARVAGK